MLMTSRGIVIGGVFLDHAWGQKHIIDGHFSSCEEYY